MLGLKPVSSYVDNAVSDRQLTTESRHSGHDSDEIPKADGLHNPMVLVFDVDPMVKGKPPLSLEHAAYHVERGGVRSFAGCCQVGQLRAVWIRQVHVIVQMEKEPRHRSGAHTNGLRSNP